jgi:hypothetical protein
VASVGGVDPDALLTDEALSAAVGALANRNAHHLQGMDDDERADAVAHWRELAVDVLVAARAAVTGGEAPAGPEGEQPGRAVIVFEDAGEEDVSVHAAFHPELQELGGDQVAGTPAQITAMALLQQLADEPGSEPGPFDAA